MFGYDTSHKKWGLYYMKKVIINLQLPESLLDRIEDYRFTTRKASRSEALRDLLEMGLKAAEGLKGEEQTSRTKRSSHLPKK